MNYKMLPISLGCLTLPLALLAGCADDLTQVENQSGKKSGLDGVTKLCSSPVQAGAPAEYESATGSAISMDVVIRDFQPTHSDFENFSEEAVEHLEDIYNYVSPTGAAMKLYGYGDAWYAAASYHNTCANSKTIEAGTGTEIGVDGLPLKKNPNLPSYLQNTSAGPVLEYGDCFDPVYAQNGKRGTIRGYKNAKDVLNHHYICNENNIWANPVIATTGMVKPHLMFTQMNTDGTFDMYDGVVISKANELCDNANFDQWFTDVPSVNKRVNDVFELVRDSAGYYVLDKGYNNGGFFPLDSINPITNEWVVAKECNPAIQPNGTCDQFGPQSLSIFCPPYNYLYAQTQEDRFGNNTYPLCRDWLNYGGPRSLDADGEGHSAALNAVINNGTVGLKHFRNFHFTMTGYSLLKYDAANPQVLEFGSSGDMWVFVDGVLVADMGGDHMLVPAFVDLKTLAVNNHGCHAEEPLAAYNNCSGSSEASGWADGSVHHLHVFYANRQTNGSEIYIRMIPASYAPSRYSAFKINKFASVTDANGEDWNYIYMNSEFADSSYTQINMGHPLLLVMRKDAEGKTQVFSLVLQTQPSLVEKGDDGVVYRFKGDLRDINGNVVDGGVVSGDQITFNEPWSQLLEDDGNGGDYPQDVWSQLMAWSKKMPYSIASASGRKVSAFDDLGSVVEISDSCSDTH